MRQLIRWTHDGVAFAFDGLVLEAHDDQGDWYVATGPSLGATLAKRLAMPNGEGLASAIAEGVLATAARSRVAALLTYRLRNAAAALEADLRALADREMWADMDELVVRVESLALDRECALPEELD